MSFSVSEFFVVGGFEDGWLETECLDDTRAFHIEGHVDAAGMIHVALEKLPTVPIDPWRSEEQGLSEYTGGGLGGCMEMGTVVRPVALWEGEACGTCRVGSVAGFCDVMGCGRTRIGVEEGTVTVPVTSCVMVAVQRAAIKLAPECLDFWDTVLVTVSCGGYSFVKEMSLNQGVSGELLVSGAEKLLSELMRAEPEGARERVMLDRDVEERVVQESLDLEAGHGNVATLQLHTVQDGADDDVVSVVSGRGDGIGYEEDTSVGVGLGERQDDFLFSRSGGAVEKSRSVAGLLLMALRMKWGCVPGGGGGDGGVVVIFGDAPGVMARELAACGVNVLGVDNAARHAVPEGWQKHYRSVRHDCDDGTTAAMVQTWLDQVGWAGLPVMAVVGDIDQGARQTMGSDTELNRGLVARTLHEWDGAFGIVRLRGVPRMPLECSILDTRHHEPQGAEVYGMVGLEGRGLDEIVAYDLSSCSFGKLTFWEALPRSQRWKRYCRDRNLTPPEGAEPLEGGRPGRIRLSGGEEYLSFVGQRNGVEECLLAGTPFMRAGREARGIIELIGKLQLVMGKVRPERVAELTGKFQPADRVHTRHVSQATLSVSPTLLRTMQVRYDELVKSCSAPEDDAQGNVLGSLTKHPGFGAILWWSFSRVRDELGVTFPYTQVKRVLPLAAMPVLASRSWVRMVGWLLRAYDRLMGKPLHTWELQALLWSLSHIGTQEEREVYYWGRLQNAVDMLLASRRRGQRTANAASADLNRILTALDALGVKRMELGVAERAAMIVAYRVAGRGAFIHDDDQRFRSQRGPGRGGGPLSPPISVSGHRRLSSASSAGGVYVTRRF